MDNPKIVAEIGRIQGELARAEFELQEWERRADSANRSAWAAVAIALIGLVSLLIWWWFTKLTILWCCAAGGAPAVVIGVVGTFVETSRRDRMHRNIETGEQIIVEHRSKLAELQAQVTLM